MALVIDYLTRTDRYGFPTGQPHRIIPRRLACIHVTANSPPVATAKQERDNVNRADNTIQRSAHVYLNRDGSGVIAIDWNKYAAWSNGVLNNPKLSVPGVSAVVDLKASGYNPNEDYWLEIENCGWYPDYPITSSQIKTMAQLIGDQSISKNLPITRETVHLHQDLDSVNRGNCPVPVSVDEEVWVNNIINIANTYVRGKMQELIDKIQADLLTLEAQAVQLETDLKTQTDARLAIEAKLVALKNKVAVFAADVADDV